VAMRGRGGDAGAVEGGNSLRRAKAASTLINDALNRSRTLIRVHTRERALQYIVAIPDGGDAKC
jgi:hypothetical protein